MGFGYGRLANGNTSNSNGTSTNNTGQIAQLRRNSLRRYLTKYANTTFTNKATVEASIDPSWLTLLNAAGVEPRDLYTANGRSRIVNKILNVIANEQIAKMPNFGSGRLKGNVPMVAEDWYYISNKEGKVYYVPDVIKLRNNPRIIVVIKEQLFGPILTNAGKNYFSQKGIQVEKIGRTIPVGKKIREKVVNDFGINILPSIR